MAGVGDLYALAQEYLGACSAALATSPGGAIDRAFVSPGLPSIDCPPQLAVYVAGPIEASTLPTGPQLATGRMADDTGSVHLVSLAAVVARCVSAMDSTGKKFPAPATLNSESAVVLGDVWAIWNYVRSLYRAKSIFTRADGERREVWFDPAIPLSISGMAAGWTVPIRVQIDGYAPVVP